MLRLRFVCPQELRKCSQREWGRWAECGEKQVCDSGKPRGGERSLIPQSTSEAESTLSSSWPEARRLVFYTPASWPRACLQELKFRGTAKCPHGRQSCFSNPGAGLCRTLGVWAFGKHRCQRRVTRSRMGTQVMWGAVAASTTLPQYHTPVLSDCCPISLTHQIEQITDFKNIHQERIF